MLILRGKMAQPRHRVVFLTALFLNFLLIGITSNMFPSYTTIQLALPWTRLRTSVNTDGSSTFPQSLYTIQPGRWREKDHITHNAYLQRVLDHVDSNPPQPLSSALREFEAFIAASPRAYMYFVQMFDEIPLEAPYWRDLHGKPQIRDYQHLLQVLNHIIKSTPGIDSPIPPIAAVLAHPMGTPSGHAAFLDPEINRMVKMVLNEWGRFLQSPASRHALGRDEDSWFGQRSVSALEKVANAPYNTTATFEDLYECDPLDEHHGFRSWDDFFTRQFRDGVRPLHGHDDDNIIVNPCESAPYNLATDVKLRDKFFVKGEPYSVLDMLGHDPLAAQFAGGTVFQSFLSMLSYHRWHAPVSGTIRRAFVVDGTYYSEPLHQGIAHPNLTGVSITGLGTAQAYLTAVSTRAIMLIEADNPNIGLMAFVAVGMEEISSCDIRVRAGQHVKKGEQLGMFHFGGSSYALVFQDGVVLEEFPQVGGLDSPNVAVRSKIALVRPSRWKLQRG